jgi:hypothetical protein
LDPSGSACFFIVDRAYATCRSAYSLKQQYNPGELIADGIIVIMPILMSGNINIDS